MDIGHRDRAGRASLVQHDDRLAEFLLDHRRHAAGHHIGCAAGAPHDDAEHLALGKGLGGRHAGEQGQGRGGPKQFTDHDFFLPWPPSGGAFVQGSSEPESATAQ
jgi:hypothetical protein